jgi:hypothetical protein
MEKKQKQVSSSLEKLIKDGKVEKSEDDKYSAVIPKQKEGEGSGEEAFIDSENDDIGGDDLDTISKYTSNWGDTASRGNPFLDSIDLSKVYLDTFKSKLD